MTIISELARRHAGRGGATRIVVGRGTRQDYPVGDTVEVRFPPLPTRREKGIDAALGRAGGPRPFARRLYRPALTALEPRFDGPVFVHNNPAPLPLLARRRPNAQVCLYANNVLFRTYGRREARRVVAAADRVICVSHFIANDLARRLGHSGDNLRVVHNGVDVDRFRPREGGLPPGDPVVLFVGRVVPEKGVHLLLRAAARVAGRRRFKVRIVGSSGFSATDPLTPYEQELRRLAEPLGDAVEFRPFVDRARVLDEYGEASIFCVPSDWDDPCPLTVGEGLACGLPMIVSRRGGIPEFAGDAALYFDPPDTGAFEEALAHLIDDEQARAEWGRRARARALDVSWERQYLTLQDALSRADRSSG
jgi:glycosyltransferase involved in cell wall biosynthesis